MAEFLLSASGNIAAGGTTATTARLTAPSGKTTGDFDAGKISDDTNPLPTIDISADGYTEVEFAVEANSAEVVAGDVYEFRIVESTGTLLDSYTVTPQWTILVTETKSVGISAVLQDTLSYTVGVSAALGSVTAQSVAVSAVLQDTLTTTTGAAAVLQDTLSATVGVSASLGSVTAQSVGIGAVLQDTLTATVGLTAVLGTTSTLVDTGLVVRFPLDEAASGTGPTTLTDVSGNAYHIDDIDYGSSTMAFTEDGSGNRGLVSSDVAGDHYALKNINNTSDVVRDAFGGGCKNATIEIVLTLTNGNNSGGRIFGINDRVGGNGIFTLKANNSGDTSVGVAWNGADANTVAIGTSRCVIHVVFDSNESTQNDRMRVYKDGTLVGSLGTALSIGAADNLVLGSDLDLILLNRNSSGTYQRSINGTVGWASMYNEAFTATDCDDNATALLADDDTPATGGTVLPVLLPTSGLTGGFTSFGGGIS